MSNRKEDNLFKRLNRLFKSGPVVRRKVRQLDTRVALPDREKSSAVTLFQKSVSPMYTAITANAYNMAERLMRYNDFCLAGDTVVALNTECGGMRIDELVERWNTGERDFTTFAYDHHYDDAESRIVEARITGAKFMGFKPVCVVEFGDGMTVRCTPDHRFMRWDGAFVEAHHLRRDLRVMSFDKSQASLPHVMTVKHVSPSREIIAVYDIEVSGYGNFGVVNDITDGNVIIVHNCEMEQCLHGDTRIAVPGGFEKISDLAAKGLDHEFVVYSYDHNSGNVVPAWAKEARQTTVDHAYKVTLDNGKEIIGTPEHRLLLRHGHFCEIRDLKPGDALMPFVRSDVVGENPTSKGRLFERSDITLGKVLDTAQSASFDRAKVLRILDISSARLIFSLVTFGYSSWAAFTSAYEGQVSEKPSRKISVDDPAVVSVEYHGIIPLFDLTVNRYKNFATDSIISHNTPEISSALDIYADETCLTKDDIILLVDGTRATVGELFDAKRKFFEVYSYDPSLSTPVVGIATKVFKTGTGRSISKVTFADGTSLRVTENHLLLTVEGAYIRVDQLSPGMRIRSFASSTDHIVSSVTPDGVEDVYDLTVEPHHNFAVIGPGHSDSNGYVFVHNCAQDEKGRSLHIYSENPKIKETLEELFYDTLNVEFNLRPWARNLCKYGDMALYTDVHPNHGVINAIPIPINEIERIEGYDRSDPLAVKFRWAGLANRELENWEVIHMRLLGNDTFLPYGSSIIESARRIWRQLILIEDAMLVYRVVRAPERRVFYVDVGNLESDAVPTYIEQQKAALRTNQVIDKTSGRVDLRYNPMPIIGVTSIPLLDGTDITIADLSKKMVENPRWIPWVYSIDDATHRVVPGKVKWCGKNYTAKKLVRVHLDDKTTVTTAPEHPFILRDGRPIRADELKPGLSLMPFYRDVSSKKKGDYIDGYEKVYDPGSGKYEYTHRMIATAHAKNRKADVAGKLVVHHVDCDKRNNHPDNLLWMEYYDHKNFHAAHCELTLNTPEMLAERAIRWAEMNRTDEHRLLVAATNKKHNKARRMGAAYNGTDLHKSHNVNRREGQKKSWEENKEVRSKAMRWEITDAMFERIVAIVRENPEWGRNAVHAALLADQIFAEGLKNQKTKRDPTKISHFAWETDLERRGYARLAGLRQFIIHEDKKKNHKVARVEFLDVEGEDVYCMTVVGPDEEENRHNFAIQGLSLEGQPSKCSGLFIKNSVDEDYWIPVRGSDTGTKIDTLQGGQNTAAVEDVAYIQKKLFSALKVPRAYLGYDEALTCLPGDQIIPFLDGTQKTLHQLSQEFASGDVSERWVYSTDLEGNVKPGRVTRAWVTREVSELHHVTLDSGEVVRCTGNHPFLCHDGIYRRADELTVSQPLMTLDRTDVFRNISVVEPLTHRTVVSIEVKSCDSPTWVYDLEVENYNNFMVSQGVVVHNSKASLAQEDIRFSRTISMIQRTMISELNKLAIIHLFAHGFEGEDLLDFTLRMSNPSTVAQQQKLEIYRAKFEIAGSAPEGLVSREFLLKNILMLNDEEIKEIETQQREDAQLGASIEGGGGGGGSLGGGGMGGGLTPGGGEEDLFGGEGGEAPGGETPPGGAEGEEEAPPEEEEGEEPAEEDEDVDLLLSSDDPDEPSRKITLHPGETPVKASSQLQRYLYNKGRQRTHGPSKTHFPDFKKMTGNDSPSMKDPYDMGWVKSLSSPDPMGEAAKKDERIMRPALTRELRLSMASAARRWGWRGSEGSAGGVLTEGNDDDLDITFEDLSIGDEDE